MVKAAWAHNSQRRNDHSEMIKAAWAHNPQRRIDHSIRMSGENNPFFDRTHSEVSRAKMSASQKGKTRTIEHCAKISATLKGTRMGALNPNAKPVCIFGNVYPSASIASNALRAEHAPDSNYNFIVDWIRTPKHKPYTFYVTKKFYTYVMENKLKDITRTIYNNWLQFTEHVEY